MTAMLKYPSLPNSGFWFLMHSASLSLGLAAFLTSRTLKGDTAMTSSQIKLQRRFDYAVAHPFALPLWIGGLGFVFTMFQPQGGWFLLIPALFTAGWLWDYFPALTRILAAYSLQTSAQEEGKEALPCTELAKT
jgi:hypothetical protein